MLIDRFNRKHNYLRISITDSCNFRCSYCIPNEDVHFFSQKKLMTPNEVFEISKIFVNLGVIKIRLTGGEPLMRKDFPEIITKLASLPVELTLTSNGYFLDKYIGELVSSNVKSINISLDTLNHENFNTIVKRNYFQKVWDNVLLCISKGIRVKINTVVMNHVNHHEVFDFVDITKELPIHQRFIEFMPFDSNNWGKEKVIPNHVLIEKIKKQYPLFKLSDRAGDTDTKYGISGHKGTIAFISSLSNSFCSTCNRIRITADGKIKNCLFGKDEFNILKPLREKKDIVSIIHQAINKKHEALGGQFTDYKKLQPSSLVNRSMIKIGG
ncbi:MAG: GTP 3',8-cyclase MoaA [Flavobacteriales bacterium]|nr:GTP 3',8-cyclase MoaA [Flavobacteriales bacterium]